MYNILIEFGIHMKLVRLIRVCPNESQSTVWVGKHLPDIFSILRMAGKKERLHHQWFSPVL